MRPFTRIVLLAALVLLPERSVLAQTTVDPSGHWQGTVQAPNMEVKIEIDLAKNSKGELVGTFDQAAQNLKGLLLANLAVDGSSVSFQVKGSAPGERTFKGALSADGKSMSGDFASSGYFFPFKLSRTGDPRVEEPAKSAPIGKELEGTWDGAVAVNGIQVRFVLTMSNQPDGTATGSVVSVNEGGLTVPTTMTQKGSSVTLDVKAVGGSYSGTLNAEGTELVGTYTRGPLVVPLTFRRAAATEGKK